MVVLKPQFSPPQVLQHAGVRMVFRTLLRTLTAGNQVRFHMGAANGRSKLCG